MQSHTYDRRVSRDPAYRTDGSLVPVGEPARMPGDLAKVYEHPERVGKPDGVPHDIVGRVAVGLVILAGVGVLAYLAFGAVVAVLAGIVTLWLVARGLPRKARRERSVEAAYDALAPHEHPRVDEARRGDDNA